MKNHLTRAHKIIVEKTTRKIQATVVQQLRQLYLQAEVSSQTDEIDTQVFQSYLNQEVINKALVSLIIIRNLPFRMVEWPKFHTLYQTLNPESKDLITTAHSQVIKKIKTY